MNKNYGSESDLTLTSLYSRPAKVILLLVSFDGQVLEVLVADAQLVDSLQHLRQGALLVPQQLAGQLLKDQRDVVQDHLKTTRGEHSIF